jgi:hypothetical protein
MKWTKHTKQGRIFYMAEDFSVPIVRIENHPRFGTLYRPLRGPDAFTSLVDAKRQAVKMASERHNQE